MQSLPANGISPEMRRHLREVAGRDGCLRFDHFMREALYAPEIGYYRKQRDRVGRNGGTDFYTASSLGKVFADLVVAAVEELLPFPPEDGTFVELGPEENSGLLGHASTQRFGATRTIRPGESLELAGNCVVFANEVLDAQPFRRFRGAGDGHALEEAWVAVPGEGPPAWRFPPAEEPPADIPSGLPEGYLLDWPTAAHDLLRDLTARPWRGLFLTFDYGLPEKILWEERPQGSGRAYARHCQGGDLIAHPGETDLTCHLAWEPLERILAEAGFSGVSLSTQESFFLRHARPVLEHVLAEAGAEFSRDKQTLMELLHPQHLGGKFMALAALRGSG
ncbi:MAG: hypothetical protein GVY10_02360 [Verrucomicrobia bacterium]|jgi:SAM-dependent MidA family methyltransferase|nr:hypothetical protein [Verrucomicrobiota bacterium]